MKFLLIAVIINGHNTLPQTYVDDTFDTAAQCYEASLSYEAPEKLFHRDVSNLRLGRSFFASCIATDEQGEQALALLQSLK